MRRLWSVEAAPRVIAAAVSLAGMMVVTGHIWLSLIFAFSVFAIGEPRGSRRPASASLPLSRSILALGPVAPVTAAMTSFTLIDPVSYPYEPAGILAIGLVAGLAALASRELLLRAARSGPVRIAVMGSLDFAAALGAELETRPEFEFAGWLDVAGLGRESDAAIAARASGEQVDMKRTTANRLEQLVRRDSIDVIVRGPSPSGGGATATRAFAEVGEALIDLPVRLIEGNEFYERTFGLVSLGTIDSSWYLGLKAPEFNAPNRAAKRAVDLAVSSLAALVAAPLVLIAAIAIKLEDRGPVFYRQTRIGRGREPFEILKLRTMGTDSESSGAQFSRAGDPRVTRVGRVLRRTHIDELPQVFNVFRGEMSLVGPRPERPEFVAELENDLPHYRHRHLVKPGVTGWAQVRCGYAGSDAGTSWKLAHDLYYLKNRTLYGDILMMLETLAIAAKDAHRPMRRPSDLFVPGRFEQVRDRIAASS